jgi:uncharacterized protein (TIGR03067 family)
MFATDAPAEPKFDGKRHAAKPYDGQSLQGVWKPVTAVLGGQPMPLPVLKAITLRITNDLYEVSEGEPEPDRGKWTLDSASEPTITSTNGPNRGQTFPAICELEGEKLRVCYDLSGANRPREFKSIKGTQLYLVTYERKKNAGD